jgi:hypothetical protein
VPMAKAATGLIIAPLAASLADQAPVSLGEAITGIDDRNVGWLVKAVIHASGRLQFPR